MNGKDNSEYLKKVGKELKIIRIEHNLSITEVADKLGMSTATICNYENRKTQLYLDSIVNILSIYDDMTPSIFFNRIATKM